MTVEELQALLHQHDKGELRRGAHRPESREFCALEFESIVRGREFSDEPITLPDLRRLNDARWSSDAARTAGLLRVMAALWDWSLWTRDQKIAWASEIAIQTVRQIIANLPKISPALKEKCQQVKTRIEARDVARKVRAYAADAAAYAADAYAADAAADAAAAAYAAAAYAADAAAADKVLNTACDIFVQAAEQVRA